MKLYIFYICSEAFIAMCTYFVEYVTTFRLPACLMGPAASLVTTDRRRNVLMCLQIYTIYCFLVFFHCCILLEIRLTTNNDNNTNTTITITTTYIVKCDGYIVTQRTI